MSFMAAAPPRYSPRAFPAYAFIPGRAPHPTRDPRGHSYGGASETAADFDPGHWQTSDLYRYAIDLINNDYWWEAHEALEVLWIAAGRQTPTGRYLQGLIQISVAMLKRHQGLNPAAVRLATSGLEKLRGIPAGFLGVDQEALRAQVEACLASDAAPAVRVRLAGIGSAA
jgi:uncharacterized protein